MQITIYFLHVILAFTTIALLIVPGIMLEMVAHTRDVALIRRMYAIGQFHAKIGGPLSFLTAIVGFIAAWLLSIPLNSGWLIAAYVLFVIVAALGIGYHMRREQRIAALAQASPDGAPSPKLTAVIDDRMAMPLSWLSALLWAAIIWLMVAKPF
jgi:uncharacterized membrane protein